ncbi:MAG: transcriptional regulator [Alphaproteobacteria bacterium HGW-Alphaproteobacteria-1]|nr:MAG: transcriptional regulator [Alphaproteobacteria bacterium HGW-Alphaproteobacteria-1]
MTQTHRHPPPPQVPLMAGWISRLDLARELGLSVDTLRRWDNRRMGPACVRAGRRVYYRRAVVLDWLEKQESPKRANGKGRK